MPVIVGKVPNSEAEISIEARENAYEVFNKFGELKSRMSLPNGENSIFKAEYFGFLTDAESMDTLENLLYQIQKDHHFPVILTDASKVEGSWDGVNDWLQNDFMPRMIEAGLRKMAFIIAADVFALISNENFEENMKSLDSFETRMFGSEADAVAWLKQWQA